VIYPGRPLTDDECEAIAIMLRACNDQLEALLRDRSTPEGWWPDGVAER
jgi:hypothetical protein